MDDNQGASSAYSTQFARTPDGLPPFHDLDDEVIESNGIAGNSSTGARPIFADETREREQALRAMEKEGLYALLNLPKTATTAEIRERYRALAIAFHPDKHRHEANTNSATDGPAAETQFSLIQHAYAILSDPHKRAVYDLLGEEGLREIGDSEEAEGGGEGGGRRTGWKVIRRLGSPDEIRKHYQRVVYEKRMASIEAMVKAKGDISVNVDARACFLPISFFADPSVVNHDVWSRAKRVRVGGMGLKHTFETPISAQTSVVWQGQMMARNGAGGGNVVGTVRHAFGPRLWVEAGSSMMHPRIATGKATFAYDQDTFATVNAVQQTIKAPPALIVTVGRKVLPKTTGFITFRSGFWTLGPWGRGLAETLGRTDQPAVSVGLTNQGHSGSGWTIETTGGMVDKHLSLDYTIKLLDGFKIKVGAAIGTIGGINGFVNTERQITDNTRLGLGLTAALPGGLTMRIRVWRLGQKIVVPIMLSQDLNPIVALISTVIPAASVIALHHLYIDPRKRRKVLNKVTELQQEHSDYLAQKKAEALDAVALMEDYVARKVEQERSSDLGLIIISAHYGLATAFTETGLREIKGQEGKILDVTVQTQALVNAGKLQISGGRSKSNLLGFFDPCMGESKLLRIQYIFRDKLHEVTVEDQGALRAPMRAHVLDDVRNGQWEA